MKRLHVSMNVKDIEESVSFYSALFGQPPTKQKEDYAKWIVNDPSVNFSIVARPNKEGGIVHLGIQTETEEELKEVYDNISKAKGEIFEEGHTICCYSKSEKSWITDPAGVKWEAFHTYDDSSTFS